MLYISLEALYSHFPSPSLLDASSGGIAVPDVDQGHVDSALGQGNAQRLPQAPAAPCAPRLLSAGLSTLLKSLTTRLNKRLTIRLTAYYTITYDTALLYYNLLYALLYHNLLYALL